MVERRVRPSGRQQYGRPLPTRRNKRRPAWRFSVGVRMRRLIILVMVMVIAILVLRQSLTITTIKVQSPSRTTEIQAEATKLITQSFAQSDQLTFDSESFVAALQKTDPIVKDVVVKRSLPHTLSLQVTLKQPSLGWSTGNQLYLLDRDGTVIGTLPAGSKLPVVVDGSNLPVTIGSRVASTRFVDFASTIVPALTALGVVPTQLQVKETTSDLYVQTNKGYGLILDTSRDAAGEVGDLKTILTNLAAQKKVPTQYIDLRIEGKAYYQ